MSEIERARRFRELPLVETGDRHRQQQHEADEINVVLSVESDTGYDPPLVDKGPTELAKELARRQAERQEAQGHSASALMQAPSVKGGTGGDRRRNRERRLRTTLCETAQWCANCQERKTADLEVCQECGTALKAEPKGPPRFARVPPEYALFLANSRNNGLRLRHVIEFATHTDRWRSGDLIEWVSAFASGKQQRDERGPGDRGGRPRGFGQWTGAKVQDRLPLSLEAELRSKGVGFERGAQLNFSAVCLMAFDCYIEAVRVVLQKPVAGSHALGPVASLSSSPDECRELTELFRRSNNTAIVLAAMQRNTEALR